MRSTSLCFAAAFLVGVFLVAACLAGCAKPPKPIEDLTGRMDVSGYTLTQVHGFRDGDRLTAQASFSDASASFLLDLRFAIDTTARLASGQWKWVGRGAQFNSGAIAARSVMFLGGQNGPPSIGGTYDLLDSKGTPLYRVTIPATELEVRVPSAAR